MWEQKQDKKTWSECNWCWWVFHILTKKDEHYFCNSCYEKYQEQYVLKENE